MGLFGLVLLVLIVLATAGLGWEVFSSGVIDGFEKAVDIGTPIIKNLTQEARGFLTMCTLDMIENRSYQLNLEAYSD